MIKSVILPVAGKGTRLMPMTSVLPKPLFPLVTSDLRVTCVLHVLLEQVAEANIDRVALIVSPGQEALIHQYLMGLEPRQRATLPNEIAFIEQTVPRGFGDAVGLGRDFVQDQPFVILLGDHLHVSTAGPSCLTQVTRAFAHYAGVAMIGVHEVDQAEVSKVGVVSGASLQSRVYRCTNFVEKPSPELAQERLGMSDLPAQTYLAHCGIYAFAPDLFDALAVEAAACAGLDKEVELAAAQSRLLADQPQNYYLYKIAGAAYDMGTAPGYKRTFRAFGCDDGDASING